MECGIDIDMYNKIWYKTKVVKKNPRVFQEQIRPQRKKGHKVKRF